MHALRSGISDPKAHRDNSVLLAEVLPGGAQKAGYGIPNEALRTVRRFIRTTDALRWRRILPHDGFSQPSILQHEVRGRRSEIDHRSSSQSSKNRPEDQLPYLDREPRPLLRIDPHAGSQSSRTSIRVGALLRPGPRRIATRSHMRRKTLLQSRTFAGRNGSREFSCGQQPVDGRSERAQDRMPEVRRPVQPTQERCSLLPSLHSAPADRISARAESR